MNSSPLVSIIIPTRNSSLHLGTLLKSITGQDFKNLEILIVDNNSTDVTHKVANKYKTKFINCSGAAPRVAVQLNLGANMARGKYLYFIDHDMELSKRFLSTFATKVLNADHVGAWYIPEKIIASNKILSVARNFEADFIKGSPIPAARIIKKDAFFLTKGFDVNLRGGPGDWDMNNQLIKNKIEMAYFDRVVYHHEEKHSIKSYILNKLRYVKGGERYKKKWKDFDVSIYNNIVRKQYSAYYRMIGIFVEDGKWRRLIKHLDSYFLFLIIKLMLSTIYFINLIYQRNIKRNIYFL